MRVVVDQTRCDTTGLCVQELPQLFRFQPGSKKAAASPEAVPRTLEDKCRDVARRCPTRAILVIEEPGDPRAG